MSSVLDAVLSLAPYHLMCYGTLLGTELYQVRLLVLVAQDPLMAATTFAVNSSR